MEAHAEEFRRVTRRPSNVPSFEFLWSVFDGTYWVFLAIVYSI